MRLNKNGQQWIRKFVRARALEGDVRIKTALRVAASFSGKEKADLYQVILLDEAGPAVRADMRGRAIGAEVLFAPKPAAIPGMKAPFEARYVEGSPAENGEFYGEKKELSLAEIRDIVTAMTEREDCTDPVVEGQASEHGGSSSGHGAAAPASGHGEKPAEHGESGGHEAAEEHASAEGEHSAEDAGEHVDPTSFEALAAAAGEASGESHGPVSIEEADSAGVEALPADGASHEGGEQHAEPAEAHEKASETH
ncbi:hypothetical protein [Sinorhizobium sp. BG8]|uniref:hypothetical protein n=1 Tax=Sinorhizobium sp. BG8 TaxID=2613773 RepID=UPI00193C9BDD|nr:hypothetical protein [Sinorhizobium sp. BG8]QRM53166.1 hypothetical protein F3Y30_00225 [Sinorhizobium sp. BG8]